MIMIDGRRYLTVEHAYQAAKTTDPDERLAIRIVATVADSKALASRILHRRIDWSDVKLNVMQDLIHLKFQNSVLRRSLIDTGDVELIHGNTSGDFFWGMCNRVGENHLGKILMSERKLIR
jgi:ribA/ribD-fused uncharacterized protein